MSKIIDITNKLNFEEKPYVKIKDTVIKVNNDAYSMLGVAAILEDSADKMRSSDIKRLAELLFDEEERRKIDALSLDIRDYVVAVMQTATIAVNHFEQPEGEAATPATT